MAVEIAAGVVVAGDHHPVDEGRLGMEGLADLGDQAGGEQFCDLGLQRLGHVEHQIAAALLVGVELVVERAGGIHRGDGAVLVIAALEALHQPAAHRRIEQAGPHQHRRGTDAARALARQGADGRQGALHRRAGMPAVQTGDQPKRAVGDQHGRPLARRIEDRPVRAVHQLQPLGRAGQDPARRADLGQDADVRGLGREGGGAGREGGGQGFERVGGPHAGHDQRHRPAGLGLERIEAHVARHARAEGQHVSRPQGHRFARHRRLLRTPVAKA